MKMIKQSDLWRKQYRANPYMNHLSKEGLEQRTRDVLSNFLFISDDGKIAPQHYKGSDGHWLILWTHILEEFKTRYGPYPSGFTNGFIKKFDFPVPPYTKIPKASEIIKNKNLKDGEYLIKYGEYKYLKETLKKGAILISPASSYNDSSLNHAIKDDELSLSLSINSSDVEIRFINPQNGIPYATVEPRGHINYKVETETNYYVYCLASHHANRAFYDFKADSCLIIYNPKIFLSRLKQTFAEKMQNWQYISAPVGYIDPVRPPNLDINIFFSKHFRYSYQKEYRVVWTTQDFQEQLPKADIELGSLEDICEVINLNDL